MPIDVSVLIATRNRADSLRRTLASVAAQRADGLTFEIVVIDNGSQDHTRQVVAGMAPSSPVPIRYLHEPHPGKPHALNRGVEAARGEFIALTDDDVIHAPDWLWQLAHTLRGHGADGAGGPVQPLWVSPRPPWLTDPILRQLGMADFGPTAFQIRSTSTVLIGPNSMYRRALFAEYGGYEPGHPAEDSEWCIRLVEAGRALWYQPAARVWHSVDGDHLTVEAVRRRFLMHGRGYGRRVARQPGRRVFGIPLWVLRLYAQLHAQVAWAWLRGDRDIARWHWLRRYLYQGVMAHCVMGWLGRRPSATAPRLQLTGDGPHGAEAERGASSLSVGPLAG